MRFRIMQFTYYYNITYTCNVCEYFLILINKLTNQKIVIKILDYKFQLNTTL